MCLNIEVEKQKQRIIKKKKKKKNMIFFFGSPPEKLPEVAGVGRPVAVDGGRWRWTAAGSGSSWLEMAAGPKSLGLKLVLRAL
jgi:hypothetical protein